VTLSMPEYIPKAIQRFNNNKPFHHLPCSNTSLVSST
jgi:hypothetical protein